ncbi:MAG: hypothetical protein ISN29_00100 [Gammaproteobacteria bacterium AqS3]|nr:hypothetical protein [Gammaproteobacteria bacterium AqS3]
MAAKFDGKFYKTPDRKPPKFTYSLEKKCLMCDNPSPVNKRREGTWRVFCSESCQRRFRKGFNLANGVCVICESKSAVEGVQKCESCRSNERRYNAYRFDKEVIPKGKDGVALNTDNLDVWLIKAKKDGRYVQGSDLTRERRDMLHLLGFFTKPAPVWYNTPLDESAVKRDEEGNEIPQQEGQVELNRPSRYTPRELLAQGVGVQRQVKQWLCKL